MSGKVFLNRLTGMTVVMALMIFSNAFAEWLVEEDEDKLSKKDIITALVESDSGNMALGLFCDRNSRDVPNIRAIFLAKRYLNSVGDPVPVSYVIDDNELVEQTWRAWTRRSASRSLSIKPLKKSPWLKLDDLTAQLIQAETLAARIRNYAYESEDAVFDVTESDDAISEFLQLCYVKSDWAVASVENYFTPTELEN